MWSYGNVGVVAILLDAVPAPACACTIFDLCPFCLELKFSRYWNIWRSYSQLTAEFSCWYSAADSSPGKLLFTKLRFLNWCMRISRTLLTVARTLQSPVLWFHDPLLSLSCLIVPANLLASTFLTGPSGK